MGSSKPGLSGLIDTVKEYVNTRVDTVKLAAAEKISLVIADLVAGAIVALVAVLFLLFSGTAAALALSAWLGNAWCGFGIVAGIYGLAGILTWAAREKMIRLPVMNRIIRRLFKQEAHEED